MILIIFVQRMIFKSGMDSLYGPPCLKTHMGGLMIIIEDEESWIIAADILS